MRICDKTSIPHLLLQKLRTYYLLNEYIIVASRLPIKSTDCFGNNEFWLYRLFLLVFIVGNMEKKGVNDGQLHMKLNKKIIVFIILHKKRIMNKLCTGSVCQPRLIVVNPTKYINKKQIVYET